MKKSVAYFRGFVLSFILIHVSTVSAASFFVRTDGSDTSCNGLADAASTAAPNCAFRSIQKSGDTAQAGDKVTIQAGAYSETVNFNNSGTAAAPISFTGTGVTLKGNLTTNGSYLIIDGLTVSPPSAGGWGAVTISGQHNTLKNCLVTNYGATAGDQATAISLDSDGSFNTVEYCTIRDLNDIDVFHIFGHDQILRHNYVTNVNSVNYSLNHTDFFQTWGFSGSMTYNILVDGNLVTNSTAQLGNTSVDGNSALHDITFRNNIFANIGSALFSGVPNTVFYNNIFYNVGKDLGYAVSLYSGNGYNSAGAKFINNVFLNNGIDVNFHDGNSSDVTVFSNNYFADSGFIAKKNGEAMGVNFINGGNPNFTNLAGLDFHLQAGGVLIGHGLDLSSLFNTDKDDQLRSSPWDIGPYAFTNGSTPVISLKAPSNLRIVP